MTQNINTDQDTLQGSQVNDNKDNRYIGGAAEV